MDNINLKFSQVLKQLRYERKITQEELAEIAEIDYKHLQKLEGKNPSSPTLSTLEKLAKGLGIKLSDIIKLIEDEK